MMMKAPRPISDSALGEMIMTYDERDIKGRVSDFNLKPQCYTLLELPSELRIKLHQAHEYENKTFTDMCMEIIEAEMDKVEQNRVTALSDLLAHRAASIKGETIPALDRDDGIAATPISSYGRLQSHSFKETAADQFAVNELYRERTDKEVRASEHSIFADILHILPIDIRAQVVSKVNDNLDDDDNNRFWNKNVLKALPTTKFPFDGKAASAGQFIHWLVTTTANYDFGVRDFLGLVELNVIGAGMVWYRNNAVR